jgi:hypothetical protein
VDYSTTTPGRVAKPAASAVQAGALPHQWATAGRACHRHVSRSGFHPAPTTIAHDTSQFLSASMVDPYASRDTNRLNSRDMEGTTG